MERLNKMQNRIVAFILAFIAVFALSFTATAAETDAFNTQQKGQLTVTLKSGDETVSGGTLSVYYVAVASVSGSSVRYTYTPLYASCSIDVDDTSNTALVGELESLASADTPFATATVGSDGKATFNNLSTGLYLVVQSSSEDYTMQSFVVSVPSYEDGVWSFAASANPKVELSEDYGGNTNTGGSGDTNNEGGTGTDGTDGSNGTNGSNGSNGTNGSDSASGTNGTDGSNGSNGSDGSDGANGASGLGVTDGSNGSDGSSSNGYSYHTISPSGSSGSSSSSTTLPQTGQLYWPIPVLIGAGVVLIVAGLVLRSRKRKKDAEE